MKVLLSSVFGPYGVDDAYGRRQNVVELFHNQITREQGIFSVRAFHPSYGLYMIAENIGATTRVLDFPDQATFIEEAKRGYEYIGISFIAPNYVKAKRMAEIVREVSPETKIVLGGHGVRVPEVKSDVPHDFLCQGEGVSFFRRLLGEDPGRKITHPVLKASFGVRLLGVPVSDEWVFLCPGLGCPKGCRFCSTSHFFQRKYVPYLKTGAELFDVCRHVEEKLGLQEFFVCDENFLLHEKRVIETLDLMRKHEKPYRFSLFSSADTISRLGVDLLAQLGVIRIWIGVESKLETYTKNREIDFKAMVKQLRDHGICVIASGILFLEEHDKTTIWEDIRFMVELEADFVQFMQLCPLPTTRLYLDYQARGVLRDVPYEEWHGQHRIWFEHPHFTPEESEVYLRRAFRHDYDTLGPSLVRTLETLLRGYQTISANYHDPFMRRRADYFRRTAEARRVFLPAALAQAHNARSREIIQAVIDEYKSVLGPMTGKQEWTAELVTRIADREAERITRGEAVYQPATIVTDYRM